MLTTDQLTKAEAWQDALRTFIVVDFCIVQYPRRI
jgi:hypothetical protein